MTIAHVTNHIELAVDRLRQQFRGKPRIEGLISAHAARTQDAEDVFWAIRTCDELTTATGAQLDDLGALVGQARGTLTDVQYRAFIAARILINMASGTVEELHAIFAQVMSVLGGNTVAVREDFPATLVAIIDEAFPDGYETQVAAMLRAARAGGVRSILEWSKYSNASTFAFAPAAAYPNASVMAAGAAQGATTIDVENVGYEEWGPYVHIARGENGYSEVVKLIGWSEFGQSHRLSLASGLLWGHAVGEKVEPLPGNGFGHVNDVVRYAVNDFPAGGFEIEVDDAAAFPASGTVTVQRGLDHANWFDCDYTSIYGDVLYLSEYTPLAADVLETDAIRLSSPAADIGGRLASAKE